MSLLTRSKSENKNYLMVKGAGEVILKNSTKYMN